MSEEILQVVYSEHEENCSESIDSFKRDLKKMRTSRASSGMLEGIVVDFYGAKTAIGHMAQISVPDPNTIQLQVYDQSAVKAVEKSIATSDLGFNPSVDGNIIRINVPPLNEERRKEIVKYLHKIAEDRRISVRNHRRDANDQIKKLEKNGDINQDDCKRALDNIQEDTDNYIKQIDELLSQKEAECMEV